MYIRQIFLIQIKYRLQSMYNHIVGRAASVVSPLHFILLGFIQQKNLLFGSNKWMTSYRSDLAAINFFCQTNDFLLISKFNGTHNKQKFSWIFLVGCIFKNNLVESFLIKEIESLPHTQFFRSLQLCICLSLTVHKPMFSPNRL